jgi:hypothetical protein
MIKRRIFLQKLNNDQGIAMVMTLFFAVVLFGISEVFLIRTLHESRMMKKELETQKIFYTSNAVSQLALNQLNTFVNTYLMQTISNSNPNGVVSYTSGRVSAGDGIGWLVFSTRNNNVPVLTQNEEQAEYTESGTLNSYNYVMNIYITEKANPAQSGVDAWDFPYFYKIKTTVSSGGVSQNVFINGDFTVRIQRDSFARYALFTNSQTMPNGTNVWFTDRTNFTGPVHTNGRFNFAFRPSGTFEGLVTQHYQSAQFYNNGFPILLNASYNGVRDVPVFNAGFTRNVSSIALSSPVQQTNLISQATDGGSYSNNGIYIPSHGNQLDGGIYVKGNSSIALSTNGNSQVYTITQGSNTKVVTLDIANETTSVFDVGSGTTNNYNGLPHGTDSDGTLIHVDGNIQSLSGTVQSNEKVTISSSSDIIITNHLRYESYDDESGTFGTAGYVPPSADGYENILGLISWNGDIRIGTGAPDDIDIHGTVLARNGVFTVDDYDEGSPRGIATLLGGVITDDYGAFGQFSSATGQDIHGYGRNFVYDTRMQAGALPPYFPTLETFVAFTNDLTDKLIWQQGE